MMQRKWMVTAVVCAGVFMSSLDLFIVNIAFPSIAASFGGASLSSLSWIVSGYAIVFAALLVPAGRWADAFGRKRAFLLGLGIFGIASAASAAAPSVGALIAARVVQAVGGALMLPTSLGLMLPEFELRERHLAIGVWAATGAVAAAAGPPLGGLLVQLDWRLVFLVNVPVAIAALSAGRALLVERREQNALNPDLLGAAGFSVAIASLVLAIVKAPDWGWTSAPVIALMLVTLSLLAGIWRRSQRHPSPLVEPALLRVRSFRLAVAGSVVFFAGFAAMLLNGVLFLTSVWHESALTAGLMLFPGPLMAALFAIPSARLGARFGFRRPGLVGGVMFALAALWWITQVGTTPNYLTEFLPGMVIGGASVGLMIPTLTGAGTSALPPERFATGAAVLTMGRQVGSALGVAMLVAVLGSNVGELSAFRSAWLITAVSGLAAAFTLAFIRAGVAPKTSPAAQLNGTGVIPKATPSAELKIGAEVVQ
jgi:EmrB/QacA subfamily drug resistance transporter